MPIQLVTGSPGHGKSQYAIDHALQRSERENRPVYYCNIEGVTIPGWREFDPLDIETTEKNVHRYQGVPDGAILLIDEASYIFKQRKGTEDAPPEEKLLTTHRHAGYDIVIVTQHPTDITAYARRRVEDHYHLKRKRKKAVALLYHWSEGEIGDIKDGSVQNAHRATKTLYRYRPEIWGKYKSTTINTVQAERWPWKVWILPAAVVLFGFVVYQVYQLVSEGLPGSGVEPARSNSGFPGIGSESSADELPTEDERRRSRAAGGLEFVDARLQTVPGMPESEPRYAGLIGEPVSYPRLQCVVYGHKPLPKLVRGTEIDRRPVGGVCKCFTQQATLAAVDEDRCREIVARGYFDAQLVDTALEDAGSDGERGAGLPAPAARHNGVTPDGTRPREPQFTIVGDNSELPKINKEWVEQREKELRESRFQ